MRRISLLMAASILFVACDSIERKNDSQDKSTKDSVDVQADTTLSGMLFPDPDSMERIPFISLKENFFTFDKKWKKESSLIPFLPPAGNQLKQGSCVAFAVCYSLISYYQKKQHGYGYEVTDGRPNPQKVYSPAFLYNSIISAAGADCREGIDMVNAINFIRRKGVCTWHDFPYSGKANTCSQPPGNAAIQSAARLPAYSFFRVPRDAQQIKGFLAAGYPIVIGIYSSKNMDLDGYNNNRPKPFLWKPSDDDIDAYHAMLCVGFNETTQTFELMNSWGNHWGDSGYCSVPYAVFFDRVREMYLAQIKSPGSGLSPKMFEKNNSLMEYSFKNRNNLDSLFKKDLIRLQENNMKNPLLIERIKKVVRKSNWPG